MNQDEVPAGLPDFLRNKASARHWAVTTGGQKTYGVCVPLFSIRSDRGCGIGDVADLYPMIDYCQRNGLGLLQLLPINDSGLDGMPYSAMSAFAIDPALIALDRIPGLDPGFLEWASVLTAPFRNAERIDNPPVRRAKLSLLRQAFELLVDDDLVGTLDKFRQNNDWVDSYSAFKVVKNAEELRSWEEWTSVPGMTVEQVIESVRGTSEFIFHVFCQWIADRQFFQAHQYARGKGVLLEGDIPILVARDSADVWADPWMFNLQYAAGAPPDLYSGNGQHWGFPTYNWQAVENGDYRWWRKRLAASARYFDCYRIDHVVGFFRIWTVPAKAPDGRNGWLVPGDESKWGEHGRKILQMMLDATDMLPLGEDLGTIPDICREVLLDMGICGLKVQRWEKRWNTDGRFIDPADYQPVSAATLSTHDCELAADWWRAAGNEDRQELWELMDGKGEAPAVMSPELAARHLEWFSDCESLFVVHALGDILYAANMLPGDISKHRVNLPGVVSGLNWSWRCPVEVSALPPVRFSQ